MRTATTVLVRPPAEYSAAALRADLGSLELVSRGRRAVPPTLAAVVVGLAAVGALIAALADVRFLAVLLVPLGALGLVGYGYLLPPAGGRAWVVVYAQGLVAQGGAVVVRWDEVERVATDPATGDLVLGEVRIPLAGLDGRGLLLAAVDRHVQPVLRRPGAVRPAAPGSARRRRCDVQRAAVRAAEGATGDLGDRQRGRG
jgi:hypothetical protein